MATLTQTAYISRQAIKYGSIFLVVFIILRAGFVSFRTYWKKAHPPPPPPPTAAFGQLPKLSFPERNQPGLTFKLETISGVLPKLPTQAKVFFIPQPSANFLVWDKTEAWARSLGFAAKPVKTDEFTYKFTSDTFPKTTLEVNVLTRNFHLTYNWQNDLEILSQGNPPQEQSAVSLAKSFLQNASALTQSLSEGKTETIYFKYQKEGLVKALFFSEANFVRVNLFRRDIEGIKVVPPNPKEANVSVLLSPPSGRNRGIVEVKYIHFPVSEGNYATYPLREGQSAWSQLTAGKGFIANLGNNPGGNITIRNVYLAYYESDAKQSFLQPVIVFEGDNDFLAYIPAITDKWVK